MLPFKPLVSQLARVPSLRLPPTGTVEDLSTSTLPLPARSRLHVKAAKPMPSAAPTMSLTPLISSPLAGELIRATG